MPPSPVRSRGPLAGPALLVGLVAVVGAALFVLFPGRAGIQRQVTDVQRPDPVSLAYLRALSAERPDDAEARLRLSGEYLRLGRLDEAHGTVAPLLDAPEAAGRSARLLALRIDAARWRGLPEGERGPVRAGVERALAERLGDVAGDVAGDETRELEALALELGRMDLAAELALREAGRVPKQRVPWLVRAGEHHLAQGQPALAAADFVHAAEAARGAEGHGLAARALDTLRGVPDPERVLALTSRLLARYPGQAELLDRAVGLARAHGRGADARGWMSARLALSPTDAAVVERALELALAEGDLPSGLALAKRLVALRPARPESHEKLATVAEWAGAPAVALPEWVWLADRAPSGTAVERALGLARGLPDASAVARMLSLRQARGRLSREELRELVRAFEDVGAPDSAERLLRTHLRREPGDGEAWGLLADLQERRGALAEALATREEMAGRLGTGAGGAAKVAELLWRLGQPEAALERLRAAREKAGPRDAAFWALYGELAWTREAPDALAVYRGLARAGRADPLATRRLLRLALEAGEVELAVAVGRDGFRAHGAPDLLLGAAEAAASAEKWDALREVLAQAAGKEAPFAGEGRYWSLKALLAEREGRPGDALSAYEKALGLAPDEGGLRLAVLWLLYREGDRARLAGYLDRWRAEAQEGPAYWRVYASGLALLGRRVEARPFLERLLRERPDDAERVLEYAEALDAEDARVEGLRRRALALLGPEAQRALREGGEPRRMLTWVALLERLDGPKAAEPWVAPLLQRAGGDAAVRDWAIGYFLREGDFPSARAWMERQRASGRTVPVWQRLQLAYGEGDRGTLAELVARPDGLSASDRFFAQGYLGRDVAAWRLGRTESAAHPELAATLGEALERLDQRLADAVTVRAEDRTLGWLGLSGAEVSARTARLHEGVLGLRAGYLATRLDGAPPLLERTGPEVDAALFASFGPEGARTRVTAGVGSRGDVVPYGMASHDWTFLPRARLRAEVAINEPTDATAALRLFGARSRLSTTLAVDLPGLGDGFLTAGARQYRTRAFEELATGYAVEAEVGRRIPLGFAQLRLRGSGSWESNRPVDALPGRLLPAFGAGTGVGQIVPPFFANAGFGASLGNGDPSEPGTSWRYLADVWGGYLAPANRPGYQLRVRAGFPLYPGAQVQAGVGFANTVDALPVRTLDLMFCQRFGR